MRNPVYFGNQKTKNLYHSKGLTWGDYCNTLYFIEQVVLTFSSISSLKF